MASTAMTTDAVAPMRQRQTMEFPYKHSTGETVGRFLAGLKEQKKIWGQRVSGQGVVVPPLGYSEVDASAAGEWVEVQNTGVVTAAARVDHPIERLHPSATPFVFVLVKLDGADTALAHFVKDEIDRVAVGARVEAVWAPDDARVGSIRDIACFRVIADAPPPKAKPAVARAQAAPAVAKPAATAMSRKPVKPKAAKAPKSRKKAAAAKPAKAATSAKSTKKPKTAKQTRVGKTTKARKKGPTKKKPAVAKKTRKPVRTKAAKPARTKTRKPTKPSAAKKRRTVRSTSKKTKKRPRRR